MSLEESNFIYQEIVNSVTEHYSHWKNDQYFSPENYGGFFPEVKK
jgi:hypothetical protein